MRVAVLGLGVIGTTYAYTLQQAGHDTFHIVREGKKVPSKVSVHLLDGRYNSKGEEKDGEYSVNLAGRDEEYDFILLDCMPSLGMLTVNALAAAEQALIPVQANYLSAKGLEQLLNTINKVRRQINPKLRIEGILLTMVDSRTNDAKEISQLIRDTYGGKLKVYSTDIPRSVRAAEISAEGKSIFAHDPNGKVADAYRTLTKEVMKNAEKRRKHQLEQLR